MAGQKTGVAIRACTGARTAGRRLYAHCYSHALNLAASNMLKQCALLKDAISTSHNPIKTYKIIHHEENA